MKGKYIKEAVMAGLVLLSGLNLQADTVWSSSTVWAFTDLGNSSTNASSVQGWYFSATKGTSTQTINGIDFTGLNIGSAASGSDGTLSWSGASGYDLSDFSWGLESARDAVSVGGLHGNMSLSFQMEAGLDYVIELVSLQASYFSQDRAFDLAVDGEELISNYWVPNESPYNNHVIITGTSDGSIDLSFSPGDYADGNPAISMITVAQVVPEPAVMSLIGLFSVGTLAVRRIFMK